MKLNLINYALISVLPLLIGYFWYIRNKVIAGVFKLDHEVMSLTPSIGKVVWLYLSSLALCFGFVNLVIHQVGFYELFFTDIMMGSEEAVQITQDFLSKYGDKHRHFMHGVFHGAILSVFLALPFISLFGFLQKLSTKELFYHSSYWLITCMLTCGLIAEFV